MTKRQKMNRTIRKGRLVLYKETLVDYKENLWSFIGSFIGIGLIAWVQSVYLSDSDNLFLIGSFGATSVLIYGVLHSPLAQPRNLVGGHLISAFIGVTVYKFLPEIIWLTAPLAVSLSIVVMQYTKTLHPPGGATALIAITGSTELKSLGYLYIIFPVLTGVVILLIVALIVNNMTSYREYPVKGRFLNGTKRLIRRSKI